MMINQLRSERGTTLRRRAAATVEIVLALGITIPFVGVLFKNGLTGCRNLWHVIANTVGMPCF